MNGLQLHPGAYKMIILISCIMLYIVMKGNQ
jgi:hypothetical protein